MTPQEKAIDTIFRAACNLERAATALKMKPPGHKHYQAEDIVAVKSSIASVQSGLSELKRVIRSDRRALSTLAPLAGGKVQPQFTSPKG